MTAKKQEEIGRGMKMLHILIMVMVIQVYTFVKTHKTYI